MRVEATAARRRGTCDRANPAGSRAAERPAGPAPRRHERQKKALYEGQVAEIVSELELQLRLSEAKAVTNACEKFATT